MTFKFESTDKLKEVVIVSPDTYEDERGFFRETYKASAFHDDGFIDDVFTQTNVSVSRQGVLRGLHYQRSPHQVSKLVSVASGKLFDVAVDLRSGSPTYGKWAGEILSQDNGRALYIPTGFAHGFLALEDNTVATYLMKGEYNAECDAGIRYDDPKINIPWVTFGLPLITSAKDKALPYLSEVNR